MQKATLVRSCRQCALLEQGQACCSSSQPGPASSPSPPCLLHFSCLLLPTLGTPLPTAPPRLCQGPSGISNGALGLRPAGQSCLLAIREDCSLDPSICLSHLSPPHSDLCLSVFSFGNEGGGCTTALPPSRPPLFLPPSCFTPMSSATPGRLIGWCWKPLMQTRDYK